MISEEVFTIRRLEPGDKSALKRITEETSVFSEEEVAVAVELMEACLHDPGQKDYYFFVAVDGDRLPVGFTCVGLASLTQSTYDLYWIVVKPSAQHSGIGRQLLKRTEEWVNSNGGTLMIAETSSTPKYEKARKFYLSEQFDEIARIRNYYKPGDDLVIFGKYLSQPQGAST